MSSHLIYFLKIKKTKTQLPVIPAINSRLPQPKKHDRRQIVVWSCQSDILQHILQHGRSYESVSWTLEARHSFLLGHATKCPLPRTRGRHCYCYKSLIKFFEPNKALFLFLFHAVWLDGSSSAQD